MVGLSARRSKNQQRGLPSFTQQHSVCFFLLTGRIRKWVRGLAESTGVPRQALERCCLSNQEKERKKQKTIQQQSKKKKEKKVRYWHSSNPLSRDLGATETRPGIRDSSPQLRGFSHNARRLIRYQYLVTALLSRKSPTCTRIDNLDQKSRMNRWYYIIPLRCITHDRSMILYGEVRTNKRDYRYPYNTKCCFSLCSLVV